MAIEAVDWQVFVSLFLVLVFLMLAEWTAIANILGGVAVLVLAAVLDAGPLSGATDFVRYGTFVSLVILAILLWVRGILDLPGEFARGD